MKKVLAALCRKWNVPYIWLKIILIQNLQNLMLNQMTQKLKLAGYVAETSEDLTGNFLRFVENTTRGQDMYSKEPHGLLQLTLCI
ncbi:hypothetical protein CFP56_005881 [Quercus suber]|uniref:Uncharacterized protein n=1 Tax=Quercus suber TaxID=58331 RepID=A0AAW0M8C4_QUESU